MTATQQGETTDVDTPTAEPTAAPDTARLRDAPVLLVLVIAAQLVVLQLVLRTPFLGDDGPNQLAAGYADHIGLSLLGFIWQLTVDQYHGVGRLTPLSMLQNYSLNGLVNDRVTYKLILVALTILSTLALARVLVRVRVPVAVALLGAGLTAALWQIHAYHDPLVSYGGLAQSVLILSSAATLCHLRWIRGGSVLWVVGSVLLLITANLLYEASYLMVGMVIGATIATGGRLRTLLPAVVAAGGFLVFLLSVRTGTGQYATSLAIDPFTATLAKQVTAAFPAVSWVDPQGAKSLAPTGTGSAWLRGLLAAALLAPVVWAALQARPVRLQGNRVRAVGLLILIATPAFVPAALVSVATRYQAELRWGTGYLPVLLTVAGVAAGAALLLWLLAGRVPRKPLAAVTLAGVVVAVSFNAQASMRVVSRDFAYATAQDDLRSLARNGAFDGIPTTTTVLFDQARFQPSTGGVWLPGYGYATTNWLYVQAGKRWPSFPLPAGARGANCTDEYGSPLAEPCPELKTPVTWVQSGVSVERRRWLLLTPAPKPRPTDVLTELPASGPATLFYPTDRPPPVVSYAAADGAPPVSVDPSTLRRLPGTTGQWARYEFTVPTGAFSGAGTVQ